MIFQIILSLITYSNLLFFFPLSLIYDDFCKSKHICILYQQMFVNTFMLFLFYNALGKMYLKKWGEDPVFFRQLSLEKAFVFSIIPTNIYTLFWVVFFFDYGMMFF